MTRAFRRFLGAVAFLGAAACSDTQGPPVTQQMLLPDSAEQMAFGVSFVLTDDGVRRAVVKADTLLTYDQNTREELRKINATFFALTGEQDGVLTALAGSHSSRLGTMEARGDVLVISREGERLTTPHLRYDPSRNEISSDSAFTLTQGERVTKGVGFVSNPDMTNMRILAGAQVTGQDVRIPRR
jgi:LPS export ABC transporter protein LptC